jgi:uncharacterized cysteine cluster protein YcgN (CxxCxxCC family)
MKSISREEWEKICDNCGKCCLLKLQDEDSDEIFYTNVICRYYDLDKCRCSVYEKRCELVPECVRLDENNVSKIEWMPKTCAYRRLFDANFVAKPQKKLKGRVVSQKDVQESELEDYIIDEDDL